MSIFVAIVLYLVVGTVLTLWLHDSSYDAEFSTWENVLGYICAILLWPVLILWPFLKGVYLGLKYLIDHEETDWIKEVFAEQGAEGKAQKEDEP